MKDKSNQGFKNRISAKQEKNKKILELKEKYEKNEIFEKDMTEEEIKALIKLYENEERELDQDLAVRKAHISKILFDKNSAL